MSELIKREDAVKATWHEPSYTDAYNVLTEVRDRIEALPTVDAVKVVRCKECKHYRTIEDHSGICVEIQREEKMPDDWYCADGERRTDGV